MAAKLAVRSPTLVALLVAAALWTSCAILPAAMAADAAVQPASASALPAAAAAGVVPPPTVADSPAALLPNPTATAAAAAAALLPSTSTPPETPAAASSTTTTAAAAAAEADTESKKFPVPHPGVGGVGGGEQYNPAAEVASALPVPTPDELPSAASLGFDGHGLGYGGPGDACCGGAGGYGWFGGPGGYGPGTYGYTGPLYWGAAPAGGWGSVAAANVVAPLVVACVFAAFAAY